MERHDMLAGVNFLILILLIEISNKFSFSLVANLLVFSIYSFLYYDFTNYRSHSQYLLKREVKPSYGSMILAVLLLGISRILSVYGSDLNYSSSTLPWYHLLEEYLFLAFFAILLIKFIVKDLFEVEIKAPSTNKIFPETITSSRPKKEKDVKEKEENEEQKIEIVKEKGNVKENGEEIDIKVKKLPVIIITTED